MKIVLPAPGEPGTHLGISHAIKHYLDPAERWDDLADDIDPNLRPSAVVRELEIPEPPRLHEKYRRPCDAMRSAWPRLGLVFSHGYGAIIGQYCDQMPPYAWGRWRRLDPLGRRHAAHLGFGVLAIVTRRGDHEVVSTAFRPSAPAVDAAHPPNPDFRALRNLVFEKAALRKLELCPDAALLAELEPDTRTTPPTPEAP